MTAVTRYGSGLRESSSEKLAVYYRLPPVVQGGVVAVVDFSPAVPMFAALTLVTIVLFAFMRTRLVLSKAEAVTLLVLSGGFVGWIFVPPA